MAVGALVRVPHSRDSLKGGGGTPPLRRCGAARKRAGANASHTALVHGILRGRNGGKNAGETPALQEDALGTELVALQSNYCLRGIVCEAGGGCWA